MLAIIEEFQKFLQLIEEKRPDEGLAFWNTNLQFLTVITGNLATWNDCVFGPCITDGFNVLRNYRQDYAVVGFEVWGGVEVLLSRYYAAQLGTAKYESYRLLHNQQRQVVFATEVLHAFVWWHRYHSQPRDQWHTYIKTIYQLAKKYNPSTHIPLSPRP